MLWIALLGGLGFASFRGVRGIHMKFNRGMLIILLGMAMAGLQACAPAPTDLRLDEFPESKIVSLTTPELVDDPAVVPPSEEDDSETPDVTEPPMPPQPPVVTNPPPVVTEPPPVVPVPPMPPPVVTNPPPVVTTPPPVVTNPPPPTTDRPQCANIPRPGSGSMSGSHNGPANGSTSVATNSSASTGESDFVCMLESTGWPKLIGVIGSPDGDTIKHPRAVCMTRHACLNIIGCHHPVKKAQLLGLCKLDLPWILRADDSMIQGLVNKQILVESQTK